MISSMLARSYAGLDASAEAEQHRQWASSLAARHAEHSAATHYHLAEAARACRSWTEAEQHARHARELAVARGDREVARHAERVLADALAHTVTPLQTPGGPERLAVELQLRMKRWNPENHRGRPQRAAFRNQWVA
jgi:hypothetical protein